MDVKTWRNKWTDQNTRYVNDHSIEDGLVKMFTDARNDGITKLEFPVTYATTVGKAADRCKPWESWGPFHLYVNIHV